MKKLWIFTAITAMALVAAAACAAFTGAECFDVLMPLAFAGIIVYGIASHLTWTK